MNASGLGSNFRWSRLHDPVLRSGPLINVFKETEGE